MEYKYKVASNRNTHRDVPPKCTLGMNGLGAGFYLYVLIIRKQDISFEAGF